MADQESLCFRFLGRKIQVSEAAQEYNRILSEFSDLSREKSKAFEKWYKDAGSLDTVLKGLESIGGRLLAESVEYVVNRIIEEGVYTYNLERFIEEYINADTFRLWYEAAGTFLDGCAEQLCNAEQIKAYREQRKNSRGKFVGFGFGVSGAVKASVSAGAMNMVTGATHSLVNAFGNAITDMQLAEKRKQVYRNPASVGGLSEALGTAVYNLYSCYLDVLAEEVGEDYSYLTEEDCQTSKAITDNCMAGRIKGEAAKKAVTDAVQRWYYNEDAYRFAIRTFGDEDGAIQEMGEYFGRDIDAIKREFINKSIEQSNLDMSLHKNDLGPMELEELEKLKEDMLAVFVYYGVPYQPKFHVQLEKLENLLKVKSEGRRYVAGQRFDDVKAADLAQKDIEKIYDLAAEKGIPEEELRLRLKKLPLEREEIKKKAEELFAARRKLLQGDAEEFAIQVCRYANQNSHDDEMFQNYYFTYVGSSKQATDDHLRLCLGFSKDEEMALVISKWEMKETVKSGIVLTNKKLYIMEHGKEEFSLPLAKLAGVKMSLGAYSVYSTDGSVKVYKLFGEAESFGITQYMNKAWEDIMSLVGLLTGSGAGSMEGAAAAVPEELTDPLRQWVSKQSWKRTGDMSICVYGSDSFAQEKDEIYREFRNTFVGETVLFANVYFDNPVQGGVAVTNKKFYFLRDKKMGESIPIEDILDIKAKGLWTRVIFETTRGELVYKNHPTYFCGNEEQFVQMLLLALQAARKAAEQEPAAVQGNAALQQNLGNPDNNGESADQDQDDKEAFERMKKAAEQGDAEAQFGLGKCYYDGKGVAPNYEEAYKWWRKAAEQEHAYAQANVGFCFTLGKGVAKDAAEACRWYRKAAEQGDALAQVRVGVCYQYGNGAEEDAAEACRWYRKAAEQGNAEAQFHLGLCYMNGEGVENDETEVYRWARKAAEQGYAAGQNLLGMCYEYGSGVEEDAAEAYKWYRKAAEQGERAGQCNLGNCYYEGMGVEADAAEAYKWYSKAAEQGYSQAQYGLGMCYEFGAGIEQDVEEAYRWYRKAAEQGDADAQRAVGECYFTGTGIEENEAEAYKWYSKAAEQGDEEAQYTLGTWYEEGIFVEEDREKALEWYAKAMAQGYEEATEAWNRLMES